MGRTFGMAPGPFDAVAVTDVDAVVAAAAAEVVSVDTAVAVVRAERGMMVG